MTENNNMSSNNAGDVVSGVDVVKKSKTGLIVGGLAVLTAGAVAVVAGGGIAAYCFSDFVKNQVKLRLSSPESYYAWVYEKNAESAAKQISTAYARGLDKTEAGQQTNISLRYDANQRLKDYLLEEEFDDEEYNKEIRRFINNTDSITLGIDGGTKDALISGNAYIGVNDDRLVTVDIASDTSTMDYFVRIPELTDKWLGVEAGKMIEENSYGDEEEDIIEAYKKAIQDPRSVITPEEIEQIAGRYIKVWNESVGDVKLEKKQTLTINDIDMNYTVVSVELTEKKLSDIAESLVSSARDDALLQEILVDRLDVVSASEYADGLDDILAEIKADSTPDDKKVVLTIDTYIDAKGNIRGFRLAGEEEDQEFLAVVGQKGDQIRGTAYLYNGSDEPDFTVSLTAEENRGKTYSGTLDLVINEEESLSVEFTDLEVVNEEYGYFNAKTVFIYNYSDETTSVAVDFSTDGQSQTVSGDIILDGESYGTLTLTVGMQTGAEPTIPSRSSAYMISSEDDLENILSDYVSQEDMEAFIRTLIEKLGIDSKDAEEIAKDAADSIYNPFSFDYDWDDEDYDWDDEYEWDDEDYDFDWEDEDDDFDWDDYDLADAPAAEDGQAFIMLYDKNADFVCTGGGYDYLSYGAKYADINGNGTYTVSVSADTPEFKEYTSALPNGFGLLVVGCEGLEGAENAEIIIESVVIDGKTYKVGKSAYTETDTDYFAAVVYADEEFGYLLEDDNLSYCIDLSGVQTWKTVSVTFTVKGLK